MNGTDTASAPTTPPAAPPEAVDTPSRFESLTDHEAAYAPGASREPTKSASAAPVDTTEESGTTAERERDPKTGLFVRQRATSQRATAKDVDEIAELTKRLRQAETDAGLTAPERKAGESDRAYSLRRQAEIVEALRDARKPKPATPTATTSREALAPRATYKPAPFTEPAPKPDDFATTDHPVEDYYRAIAAHEFRKQLHEAEQKMLVARAEEFQADALKQHEQLSATQRGRIEAFAKVHPDYDVKLNALSDNDVPLSDLLAHTIWTDDKVAELLYYYFDHPAELAELSLMTGGLGVDDQSVALLRRRLHAQAINAKTGALPPAPVPVTVAPRPPTPVRTGPLKTGDEPPGDDDTSISAHEKYFGPKRR